MSGFQASWSERASAIAVRLALVFSRQAIFQVPDRRAIVSIDSDVAGFGTASRSSVVSTSAASIGLET